MIRVHFNHTRANNGGYGVLGRGIRGMLEESNQFDLVMYNGERLKPDEPELYFSYGMPDVIEQRKHYHKHTRMPHVHYCVWESSKLPEYYIKSLKKVDLVLTATRYTKNSLIKQGIKNVEVWHHAIDDRFEHRKPLNDGVFTFLHYNGYEFRKGTEVLIRAFTEEFGVNEPVKLVIKARERDYGAWYCKPVKYWTKDLIAKRDSGEEMYKLDHPLIEEKIGHLTDEAMVHMLKQADCFVFPAKGEGWGLPPMEALRMGIVPIIPNVSGFSEWFDDRYMIEVAIDGFINSEPRYPGHMWHIDKDDLKKQMRWAYMNQEKLVEMGREGSVHVKTYYSWEKIHNDLYYLFSSSTIKKISKVFTK
jgi:glycosyltransferase involved in cell wall biosynthesis